MAQQSRLETAITSCAGVAASRLSCADLKGHTEGLYSTSFFLHVDIEPSDVLLHRANQLYARKTCVPASLLGELSLWIDAQLICWHWIAQDPESRNKVSEMYKAKMVPELLADTQLVSSMMSVLQCTDFIVDGLIGNNTSVAACLIKKALSPAKERVRYVPDMFSRSMLEANGDIICTLLRAVSFGTLDSPGAIAPISFRVEALRNPAILVDQIGDKCTKRGLVIALNEALSIFPNSMVRMLVPRCKDIPSIRSGLFGEKIPIPPLGTFKVVWPQLKCRPPEIKITPNIISQLGGEDKARHKFHRYMTPFDQTSVTTAAELTLLRYCASISGSVRLLPIPFPTSTPGTVCMCVGCMTVLSNVNGRKGKRGKLGVLLVENEVRCSVCHSNAIFNIPVQSHILVDDSFKTATAICDTCKTPTVIAGITGTKFKCASHCAPVINLKAMCAICSIPLYRPSHQINIDDTPASLCAQHQGIFPSAWVTRQELHKIQAQVASKKSKAGS